MKKSIMILSSLFLASLSHAGIGGCISEQSTLTCKSYAHTPPAKTFIPGGGQQSIVEDVQPEPFEFSVCQSEVAFDTEAGKFVAVYDADSSSLRAWINNGGKDTSLVKEASLNKGESVTLSYINPKQQQSNYKFICSIN